MPYQERLVARKRLFGTVCPSLSVAGKGEDTTIPLPLQWDYIRPYWPLHKGCFDNSLLPHEKRMKNLYKFTKRFEY